MEWRPSLGQANDETRCLLPMEASVGLSFQSCSILLRYIPIVLSLPHMQLWSNVSVSLRTGLHLSIILAPGYDGLHTGKHHECLGNGVLISFIC